MRNSFRCSLSLLPSLALALLAARPAKADLFNISGMATNATTGTLGSCAGGATCSFSGTLTVDVSAGTVGGVDITLPGLLAFDTVSASGTFHNTAWAINADNSFGDSLQVVFTTTPTPGSLVGFEGGTVVQGLSLVFHTPVLLYFVTGTITLVAEPSSRGTLAVALLAFAGIIRLRKRKPVVTA